MGGRKLDNLSHKQDCVLSREGKQVDRQTVGFWGLDEEAKLRFLPPHFPYLHLYCPPG